jgi:hypothetical protein
MLCYAKVMVDEEIENGRVRPSHELTESSAPGQLIA